MLMVVPLIGIIVNVTIVFIMLVLTFTGTIGVIVTFTGMPTAAAPMAAVAAAAVATAEEAATGCGRRCWWWRPWLPLSSHALPPVIRTYSGSKLG